MMSHPLLLHTHAFMHHLILHHYFLRSPLLLHCHLLHHHHLIRHSPSAGGGQGLPPSPEHERIVRHGIGVAGVSRSGGSLVLGDIIGVIVVIV